MQILIAHVPLSMPRTCPHGACSSAATLPWNMRERCELLHSRTICLRLLVYYVQATQSSSDGQFDPGETWQTEHEMSLLSDNQMSLSLQAPEVPRSLVGFCDAPRISAAKYRHPAQQHAKLVHVIHVQRHHKRTPDNLVSESEASFNPPEGWQCADIDSYEYARGHAGSARIQRTVEVHPSNPLHHRIWNGTCDVGELTAGGLADSVAHGQDLSSVYGRDGINSLLTTHGRGLQDEVRVRTSPSARTMKVAGGILRGMGYPDGRTFPVTTTPSTIDGIVPSYSCAYTDQLRSSIEGEKTWTDHLASQSDLFRSLNEVLGTTAQDPAWNTWIDRAFDMLMSRQCHGHALPTNSITGSQISQETADAVYAEGNWEYNYIWNDSPRADEYTRYSLAVLVNEFELLLKNIQRGSVNHKLTLFVGHDGTMVRLLKTLGQLHIPWPALGSEVQIEVYEERSRGGSSDCRSDDVKRFVRILTNGDTLVTNRTALKGTTVRTQANEAAKADWVPLEAVIRYLHSRVPDDLVSRCAA